MGNINKIHKYNIKQYKNTKRIKSKNIKIFYQNKMENNILKLELEKLLQEPNLRDIKATEFFLSDDNILPNGDLLSFVYGAKKYHDYLKNKIDKM